MEVNLTVDQLAFVRQAIASGRLQDEAEAVREALSLWEERERQRGQIIGLLEAAERSMSRGEGRVITEQSLREVAEEVKRRGRARIAAEQAESR